MVIHHIKAFYEDLSQYDKMTSYGVPDYNTIYINENLPIEQLPLEIGHEVAHLHFGGQIKHSCIDSFLIDYLDALQQLGFEVRKI